jgi:hypothetical protein
MSKDQNASGKKVFGDDAWRDAVRYLGRYPKSAKVNREDGSSKTAAEKAGQQLVLASASFKTSGGPPRHYLVPAFTSSGDLRGTSLSLRTVSSKDEINSDKFWLVWGWTFTK